MMNVAKQQKNKVRGVRHIKRQNVFNLIADEKLESRLKIREGDILSKIRVLPDLIWTNAEKLGNIRLSSNRHEVKSIESVSYFRYKIEFME